MGKWLNLTALLKAQVIQFAILNGVSNIKDIRDTFNIYANGGHLGHTYDGNKEQSQQLYIKQLPATPIDTLGVRVLPSQIGSLNKGIYNLKSLTISFDLDSGKVVSVGHGNVNDPDSFYNTFVVPSFDIGVLRYRNNPTELNSYFLVLEQNGGVNPSKGYKIVGNQPTVLIVEKQKPVITPQELLHANIVEPVQKPLIKEVDNSLELNPILLVLAVYPVLNVEHEHANMLFMLPTNINAFLPLATRILENPEAYFAGQPGISEKDKDYMINYSLFIMDEWNKLSPKQKKLLLPASVLSNSIILNNGTPKQYKQLKVFHSGKIRNKSSDDNKKSTGGPLYPFSFEKNPYFKTPVVRYDEGGHMYGFGDWLTNLFRPNDTTTTVVNTEPAPLDLAELASRQAYAESRFDSNAVSPANAIGLFLVTPNTLSYYNLKTGSNYTSKDLYNDVINLQVRDWYMNDLMIRPWNTKNNPSDSVLYAKSLGAYNWGPTNLVDTLNKAKENGIDIYNSWDWLPYLPTETRDYINFVLRNLSNSSHRNNLMYNKSVSKNLAKVSAIKSK